MSEWVSEWVCKKVKYICDQYSQLPIFINVHKYLHLLLFKNNLIISVIHLLKERKEDERKGKSAKKWQT